MTRRVRRNHSPAFKAKVAPAAIKGEKHWPTWRSSSTSTRTRSRNGAASFLKGRGFAYLTAVVDWFSRKVLAWRLSITMDVSF